jgi:hypothetical protein
LPVFVGPSTAVTPRARCGAAAELCVGDIKDAGTGGTVLLCVS